MSTSPIGSQAGIVVVKSTRRSALTPPDPMCTVTDGSSQTVVDCFGGPCVDYGMPRLYVRAQVTQTFRTVVRYPGVPDPVNVQRIATMRVQ